MPFDFEVIATDGNARAGILHTPHGDILTPVFAPVGTAGTVKALPPRDLESLAVKLILANTYHLFLRPGDELVRDMGGLHQFMNWQGPLLTDSGGFQVFSLAQINKIDDDGVPFGRHGEPPGRDNSDYTGLSVNPIPASSRLHLHFRPKTVAVKIHLVGRPQRQPRAPRGNVAAGPARSRIALPHGLLLGGVPETLKKGDSCR